jgi:hypothetical protein
MVNKINCSRLLFQVCTLRELCMRESDEDISSIDTTTPATQQGAMTRARAQQLNYQVQSFLVVQTLLRIRC